MKILMDLDTGEPVLDFRGNLLECSLTRAFRQYLDVLLHTPIFEEVSLPTWGLPLRQIFQLRMDTNFENMVKYFFVQALNPRYEPLIQEVRSIGVTRDGSTLNVELNVAGKYGENITVGVSLNE